MAGFHVGQRVMVGPDPDLEELQGCVGQIRRVRGDICVVDIAEFGYLSWSFLAHSLLPVGVGALDARPGKNPEELATIF